MRTSSPVFLPHCKLSKSVSVTDVYRFKFLISVFKHGYNHSYIFSVLLSSNLHHRPLSFSTSLPLALILPLLRPHLLTHPTVWVSSSVLHMKHSPSLIWDAVIFFFCHCLLSLFPLRPVCLASPLSAPDTAERFWGSAKPDSFGGRKKWIENRGNTESVSECVRNSELRGREVRSCKRLQTMQKWILEGERDIEDVED